MDFKEHITLRTLPKTSKDSLKVIENYVEELTSSEVSPITVTQPVERSTVAGVVQYDFEDWRGWHSACLRLCSKCPTLKLEVIVTNNMDPKPAKIFYGEEGKVRLCNSLDEVYDKKLMV